MIDSLVIFLAFCLGWTAGDIQRGNLNLLGIIVKCIIRRFFCLLKGRHFVAEGAGLSESETGRVGSIAYIRTGLLNIWTIILLLNIFDSILKSNISGPTPSASFLTSFIWLVPVDVSVHIHAILTLSSFLSLLWFNFTVAFCFRLICGYVVAGVGWMIRVYTVHGDTGMPWIPSWSGVEFIVVPFYYFSGLVHL